MKRLIVLFGLVFITALVISVYTSKENYSDSTTQVTQQTCQWIQSSPVLSKTYQGYLLENCFLN